MGASRNQRSKKEASFLESVRDSLQHVQDQLTAIKGSIEELKVTPADWNMHQGLGQMPHEDWNDSNWDDWTAWYGLHFGDRSPTSEPWNLSAKEFVPLPDQPREHLPQSEILLYRHALLDGPASDINGTLLVAAQQPEVCAVCTFELLDCMCEDILCRRCMKTADDCGCDCPALKHRLCEECGSMTNTFSLHSGEFLQLPVDVQSCCECECLTAVDGDWQYITPSDHKCTVCKRRDAQQLIQECDGAGCNNLCHSSCMVKSTRISRKLQKHVSVHFCLNCAGTDNACSESDDVESEESDPVIEQDRDLNSGSSASPQLHPARSRECQEFDLASSGRPETDGIVRAEKLAELETKMKAHKIWGDEEILIWAQVTINMANATENSHEQCTKLRERWQKAKPHIPADKRDRLQAMIEQKFCVAL